MPEKVVLHRHSDPLRFEPSALAVSWPTGTAELARLLDELDAPINITQRDARTALRDAGHGCAETVLRAALKYRRQRTEQSQ